jgi:hypothetical protein
LVVAAVAFPMIQGMSADQEPARPVAVVAFKPLDEMSGLVRASGGRDYYWTHNDSGDAARFFAIRADGSVVRPAGAEDYAGIWVEGAKNSDWEDIARDGNRLFLCDVGNNGNARRDLTVYEVREPDPLRDTKVPIVNAFPVAYPDQQAYPPSGKWPFDCEAVFALRGKLYFVTKHRINQVLPDIDASLYRLDTFHRDKVNVLTKLDTHPSLGGWVTGADVSPDGKTLAVLTQAPMQGIWLFDTSARGDRFLTGKPARRIGFTGAKQCEAVAFVDNSTLLVSNEQRDLYRFSVRDAEPVRTVKTVAQSAKRRLKATLAP